MNENRQGHERERLALTGVTQWVLERDAEQIVWLGLDCADATTNTLSSVVLEELALAIEAVIAAHPSALIIYSRKAGGFAAGADVREFEQLIDASVTEMRVVEVHALFARIEALPFTTVARVHGFCLGGGLELALACRHIVAADDSSTRLGFPEIMLGIHPGFGGTVRAVRDCGPAAALDLMLTGRNVSARQAVSLGLIDRAVPVRHLDAAALYFANQRLPRRRPSLQARLGALPLARPLVAHFVRKAVKRRVSEAHYPAPYALLRLWQAHADNPSAMYAAEARSIAQLFTTSTSRNLVRMFRLQERLKALTRECDWTPRSVHVIGAGTMGGDIAAWCALRGLHVTLQDRAPQYIAPAMKRAHDLFKRRLRDKYERLAASDRLVPDFTGDGVRRADVIIEAIIEDRDAKRALFSELEIQARPDAVLATNTSSIQLDDIAVALREPERLVGIHFFNPVAQMQLIEIVTGTNTAKQVIERANAFTGAIDRLPLPTASAPGFLINRVLSPYLQEAMILVEEGVAIRDIDQVARDFGMPMGPLELADTVGLDICLHVGGILASAFGGEVPAVLRNKVAEQRLGRKTAVGFYEYRQGRITAPPGKGLALPTTEIRDRLLQRLLNEAVCALRERVVADADSVDIAMVFGTGFAPFRGGPLTYARDRGVAEVVARLRELAARHGSRFAPDIYWEQLLAPVGPVIADAETP